MSTNTARLVSALRPKRTWLQFSLKSLMVLVVIAAMPCGLLKWKMVRKERERAAIAEIGRADGMVGYDWQRAGKKEPNGAAWFRKLLGDGFFSTAVSVNFYKTEVTDDSLANLEPLVDLDDLHYKGSRLISDVGLDHLKNLIRLKNLNLGGAKVTDAGLVHLRRLTNLQDLDLANTKVADAGLLPLKGLTQLRNLNLAGTHVTDAGLVHIKGNAKMRQLNIANTGVTDEGLVHLKAMTRLEQLYLWGTEVSDAGLVCLKGFTGLKLLNVAKTKVTTAGVDELEIAMPNCTIIR
jgi:hypothetical protein